MSSPLHIRTLEPEKLSESIKSNSNMYKHQTQTYEMYYRELQGFGQYNDRQKQKAEIENIEEEEYVENSLKKNKNGEIIKLNELKKEYEILKNIKIEDSVIYSKKNSYHNESSQELSEKSSRTNKSMGKIKNHSIIEYEKKQLEIMLANSMNKIEELLKAEVEYKRKIYELTRTINNREYVKEEEEQKSKNREKYKEHMEDMEGIKKEMQRLSQVNEDLENKIHHIQNDYFNIETENRKLIEENRKLNESLLFQKEINMTNKIEIKKIQLDKDILSKEKNINIERLKTIIADLNNDKERLTNQIKELKTTSPNQKIEKYDKSDEKIKKSDLVEQLHSKLAEKIKELEKNDEILAQKEINELKNEIENMKDQSELFQNKQDLETRIFNLEKIIEEENEEKVRLMEDLKRMIRDFEDIEQENEILKEKLTKIQRENGLLKDTPISTNKSPLNMSNTSEEVNTQKAKVRRLETENKELKLKLTILEENSNYSSKIDNQSKEYSIKLDQAEFEIEKLTKQNEFNLQLTAAKYKAEIEIAKNDLAIILREKNEEKSKYETSKVFLENKMISLKKEQENMVKSYNDKLIEKDTKINEIKGIADQTGQKIRKEYENELFSLLARLDQLAKSNEIYLNENNRLMSYETEIHELRHKYRKTVGLNEGIDHLWQVKEMEYGNINALVKELI